MGGDFNGHVDFVSTSGQPHARHYSGQNASGRQLLVFAEEMGLHLCTGQVAGDFLSLPTYRATARSTATRPDHILVSQTLRTTLQSVQVSTELRGSDHYALATHIQLDARPPPSHRHWGEPIKTIRWQEGCRIAYVEQLEGGVAQLDQCIQLANEGQLAQALTALSNTMVQAASDAGMIARTSGGRKTNPQNKPFFDNECQRLKREWRRAGRIRGYLDPEVKILQRRYHSLVRSRKRAWLLAQLKTCIQTFNSRPRRFWQMLRGKVQGLPIPLQKQGVWGSFMDNLWDPGLGPHNLEPSDLSPVAYPWAIGGRNALTSPFTSHELDEGIMSLNTGRSSGFFGYPAELIRFAQRPPSSQGRVYPHVLAPAILAIVNKMFQSGSISTGFNVSKVTPVIKDPKKNGLDISNYRPIAVPEPLMRLYATLLNKRLVAHVEGIGYRCEAQTGFRPGFSTLHQLFTLQHFIDLATETEPLVCIKIDFSKAYDMVPRDLLWEAVRRVGAGEDFINAIKSLYEDGELILGVGGTYGHRGKAKTGITQGSPLSPTLFGIYSDGFVRYIEHTCPGIGPRTRDGRHVPIIGFADDYKLLASNQMEVQRLLQATAEWCAMARMRVNALKSYGITFPAGVCGPLYYETTPIQLVTEIKHLGITFSSQAGMGDTFSQLHGKMRGAWGSILHQYGNLKCAVSIGLLLRIFLTCVVPTASYACELWGWRRFPTPTSRLTSKSLENDFLVMLRMIVGVRSTVRTDIFLAECGIRPLRLQWLKRMVTFWNSLVALPPNHLYASILRDSCYYGVTTRGPSWAGDFMLAIRSIGYPYLIDAREPHPIDLDSFRDLLARAHRLPEDKIHISPRLAPRDVLLCTYIRWFGRPTIAQRRKLLLLPLSATRVRTFARFRLGVHGLPIDTGRRTNVPRAERRCDMCGQNVGDEHHFVFHCPALTPLRERYSRLFRPFSYSLRAFMWQDDLIGVVNFIFDGFQLRSEFLRAT